LVTARNPNTYHKLKLYGRKSDRKTRGRQQNYLLLQTSFWLCRHQLKVIIKI